MATSTPTKDNSKTIGLIIKVVLAIAVAFWWMKSCDRQQEERDIEMKGRGLLEAKGYHGELPPNAGTDYYYMRWDGNLVQEDYQRFFWQIKAYGRARAELRKRGLSESDLDKIFVLDLYEAMRSPDPMKALNKFAR